MGVERVDYYSDEEYEQALTQETQEPNVVPCFECGCQMYEESNDPRGNICQKCQSKAIEVQND